MLIEFAKAFGKDLLALFAAGGIFYWFLKKWLTGAIDAHFAEMKARSDAAADLWKGRAAEIAKRRDLVYPEILELTYRLKNSFRDDLASLQRDMASLGDGLHGRFMAPRLGEPLYLLTENLYKYRPFLDPETFKVLHRFKQRLQDGQVLFNRMDRPADEGTNGPQKAGPDTFRRRYQESEQDLKSILTELEQMTEQIDAGVRKHLESILKR